MQANTLQHDDLGDEMDEEINDEIVAKTAKYPHTPSQQLNSTLQKEQENEPYMDIFQEIFCVDETINNSILEKQRKYFGFTLFILHTKTLYDALVLGVENGIKEEKTKYSWLGYQLLNVYWFFLKILFIVAIVVFLIFLPPFGFVWLLPIAYFVYLLVYKLFPYYLYIHEKVMLLKKTQIFFNITIHEAEEMKQFFIGNNRKSYLSGVFARYRNIANSADLYAKIFFYLLLSLVSIGIIVIRDSFIDRGLGMGDVFLLFLVFFALFSERIGYFLMIRWYQMYFWILDNNPSLFSPEDQIRDYFLDIHTGGSELISSVQKLDGMIQSLKSGTINPRMGSQLTVVLDQIVNLWKVVEERKYFLSGKTQFQEFLIHLFNDIIQKYANSFEFLQERIHSIEKGITFEGLSPEEAVELKKHIQPILQKNKSQLEGLKKMILSKKVRLGS